MYLIKQDTYIDSFKILSYMNESFLKKIKNSEYSRKKQFYYVISARGQKKYSGIYQAKGKTSKHARETAKRTFP